MKKQLFFTLIASVVMLCACGGHGVRPQSGYAPWVDLSMHYDLSKVRNNGGMKSFNTVELTHGKVPFANERFGNNEYNATVVGLNVCLRSQPIVRNSTKRGHVHTGDKLTVLRPIGYANGKFWDYVYVNSGLCAGREGYICTDYIVTQEQYEMIDYYALYTGLNLDYSTPSKLLQAVSDVLLKLDAHRNHPNLTVSLLSKLPFGNEQIVVYQIRNNSIAGNNSLIAVVQFFNNNNDYVVLGVVPGNGCNNVSRNPNGSYDVYFY